MTYQIRQTPKFAKWLKTLKDKQALAAVLRRVNQIKTVGHFGDWKSVGGSVCELRIFAGKGYRVYYTLRGGELVLLLVGGDKSTQTRDIQTAKHMAQSIE